MSVCLCDFHRSIELFGVIEMNQTAGDRGRRLHEKEDLEAQRDSDRANEKKKKKEASCPRGMFCAKWKISFLKYFFFTGPHNVLYTIFLSTINK